MFVPSSRDLNTSIYPKHIEYEFILSDLFSVLFVVVFLPEHVFEVMFVYFCNFTQSLSTFLDVKCGILYARTIKRFL